MRIACKEDLESTVLEENSEIVFKYKDKKAFYWVTTLPDNKGLFLRCQHGNNEYVFEYFLRVHDEEKHLISDYFYGYEARRDTYWPHCKMDDYEALTRLVIGIYEILDAMEMGIFII